MEILDQLAVALGLATLAGLNLYLTVFVAGLAIRLDLLGLASQYEQLAVLASDGVLAVSGILFALEFFSDKIPWVDSLWDALHTLIRPVGGALLAMQALGNADPALEVIIGLLAGGTTLVTHGFKAGTRLAINASPEPVSNVVASVTEDAAVVGGLTLMAWNPVAAAGIFVVFLAIALYLTPKLFRRSKSFLWLLVHKFGAVFSKDEGIELDANLKPSERVALTNGLGGTEPDVIWSARVVTGKAKGFKCIGSQNFGKIVAIDDPENPLHFVGRRFWRPFHCALPLENFEAVRESRFLSEDAVICETSGPRKLQLRFHAGERALAGKIVEEILELRNSLSPEAVGDPDSASGPDDTVRAKAQ